jgi:hypothetical protein
MSNWAYSAFTIFGILMIGGALALQILYIKNNQNSDDYYPHQVASVVMDTLVVAYLMSVLIYYRPYSGLIETGVTVILLMVGLGLEIFSTQWNQTAGTMWLGYLLTSLNAIIRLLVLVQTRCDKPLSTASEVLAEIVDLSKKTQKPVLDIAKAAIAPLGTIEPENAYRNAMNVLNSIMDKTQLSQEEKAIYRTKYKEAFGRGENKPSATGGRRR